jgi:hypothetical protein
MVYRPNSHVYVRVMSDPPDNFMVWHGYTEGSFVVELGWAVPGDWEGVSVSKKLFDALTPEQRKKFDGEAVEPAKFWTATMIPYSVSFWELPWAIKVHVVKEMSRNMYRKILTRRIA